MVWLGHIVGGLWEGCGNAVRMSCESFGKFVQFVRMLWECCGNCMGRLWERCERVVGMLWEGVVWAL